MSFCPKNPPMAKVLTPFSDALCAPTTPTHVSLTHLYYSILSSFYSKVLASKPLLSQSLCSNSPLCLHSSSPWWSFVLLPYFFHISIQSIFFLERPLPNHSIKNGTLHILLFIHSVYHHPAIINLFVHLFIVCRPSPLPSPCEGRAGTSSFAIIVVSPAQRTDLGVK